MCDCYQAMCYLAPYLVRWETLDTLVYLEDQVQTPSITSYIMSCLRISSSIICSHGFMFCPPLHAQELSVLIRIE